MTGPRATFKRIVQWVRGLRKGPRPASEPSYARLERVVAYTFSDRTRLTQALTHTSALPQGDPQAWLRSNERMEFLGDAVLNCLITEYLYGTYPSRSEGQLSKVKSLVVSRRVLAECATSMGLGEYLILGASERKSGGRSRMSLLANVFEAVLGAVYLDGGIGPSRVLLEKHLFCRIDEFVGNEDFVNYKSILLEMAQRDGFGIPRYVLVEASGPDHAMKFRMRVEVAGVTLGEGAGLSKKAAEQQAAFAATSQYDEDTIRSHNKGAGEV